MERCGYFAFQNGIIEKLPLSFLKKAYYGLHDLELDLAVQKVGEV